MTEKKSCRKNQRRINEAGLTADVEQIVGIGSKGEITVTTTITATNCTSETIVLDRPYCVYLTHASDVTAFDLVNNQSLPARYHLKRKRVEIWFLRDTQLAPNEEISWQMSFKSNWLVTSPKDEQLMTAIFALAPLKSYKTVPITNHHISLIFKFRGVNENNLLLPAIASFDNNRNIPMLLKERGDGADVKFVRFDLPPGVDLKVCFNYYESIAIENRKRNSSVTVRQNYPQPILPRLGNFWRVYLHPMLDGGSALLAFLKAWMEIRRLK